MARTTHGGAYEARGRFFARVTIAAGQRRAVALPWVTPALWEAHAPGDAPCPCLACLRARDVQELVTRYRAGGADVEMLEALLKSAATADAEKMAAIGRAIAGFVEGRIPKAKPKTDGGNVTTFESFAMQWVRGELAALYPDHVDRKRSAYTDLCYLRKYAFPEIGPKPIADVSLEDFERILRGAPQRALPRKLAKATRWAIGQAVRRVMQLAEYPAKHVARNPIPSSALPKKKQELALVFVYPDEDTILLRDARADLGYRLLYGYLHRVGPRREEVLGGHAEIVDDGLADEDGSLESVPPLTWDRVDLRRRVILPARNKTGDVELTPMDEDIARALTIWKAMHPKAKPADPVFVDGAGVPITPDEATARYRPSMQAALGAAEQDRPELWGGSFARKPLRLHDARASMVTVALRAGKTEDWVRRRTKHRSSALERYRRATTALAELDLGFWSPLDEAIPELAERSRLVAAGSGCDGGSGEGEKTENCKDINRGDRRGLNPRQLEPQTEASEILTDSRDVTTAPEDVGAPSEVAQPLRAAASADLDLRELVADLRAMIADLRADNRRLREQLGERPATVTDISKARK